MRARASAAYALASSVLVASFAACTTKEPAKSTYFERSIAPVVVGSCGRTNTGAGCHAATEKGNALGNLDVTSFPAIDKRRDLFQDYGPYGQPAFLIKAIDHFQITLESFDGTRIPVTTDIKHTGGPIFDPTSSGYATVRKWLENGATENNTGLATAPGERLPCATDIPSAPGFDPTVDPTRPDFEAFKSRVAPVLKESCAAGNCHGSPSNELYLACGDTPEQLRWNYHTASEYLAQTPEQSELLRRPLAPGQGGSYHEGGVVFQSTGDGGYQALNEWAKAHGPLDVGQLDDTFLFFARRVQPMLAKKGCMMLQCHSASLFHDYRLRGGSGGAFSFSATRKNYELTLAQTALESEDPAASRLVRKNLFRRDVVPGGLGMSHRGGPLLEDFAGGTATPEKCDAGNYDYDNGSLDAIPAYCVFREWFRRERTKRGLAPFSGIVYVRRPLDKKADRTQDFDVYRPGADLRAVEASFNLGGTVTTSGDRSLTAGCGLAVATADIRRPTVSWDGKRIAFAARSSEAEPLQVYTMNADGSGCAKHPLANGTPAQENGLLVHNFDPAYAPPDESGYQALVFASTRGNLDPAAFDYKGPQRTPADPAKPNANLYVVEAPGGTERVRQLTYLLNMERQPAFMHDGRIIMVSEKRAPGFYQLAGRRINMDGGDYHPLFGQRPTVSHAQMTDIVELADHNFAGIFSDPGASHAGGTLGVVNRSIGVDFQSPRPEDYVVDPSVLDPAAPASPEPSFFLRSLSFPDPSATGRPQVETTGVYRSPAALPGRKLLVSWGAATSLEAFDGNYDVYVIDPDSGERTKLFGEAGAAEIEAVAVYGRASHGIFRSAPDEPNGVTKPRPDKKDSEVLYLDVPVLASLLFQNTPTGRPLEDKLESFDFYEELPPPLELTSAASAAGFSYQDQYGTAYLRRRKLGSVPVESDGSAKVKLPGGVPLQVKLPDTDASKASNAPRFQRESSYFYPGELVHQSFRRGFFDGLCGACHGSMSGRALDVAVRPDILTQASAVQAKGKDPANLDLAPGQRGKEEGPTGTR